MLRSRNFAFVASLLFAGIITVPAITYAAPAYNGIISFSPNQITASPGQTFSLSVDVYDSGVNYNSATESISLGDGLSFAGADFSGSAFNVAGTDEVEQGPYDSCVVISRSSTTILTGTSHLANVLFHVSNTPDYDTSHNGTSIEQEWTGCGPSSDIYLNGEQANQGAEEGGEIFVNLTTETPPPTPPATPGNSTVTFLPPHSSNKSTNPTTTTAPKSNSSPEPGQVKVAATESASALGTVSSSPNGSDLSASKANVVARLASAKKQGSVFVITGLVLLALILAVAYIYIRSKKVKSK